MPYATIREEIEAKLSTRMDFELETYLLCFQAGDTTPTLWKILDLTNYIAFFEVLYLASFSIEVYVDIIIRAVLVFFPFFLSLICFQ